ncbi:MAG: HNH endonuclease signature motif containing protein, partial [Phascolarctobacterium sp.]|nr:HNH endonuclease signature motif containing protein [Phascolarctobacterium sp.]
MGHSKYLDSLTAEQDQKLREKLLEIQSHKCFICGETIDAQLHTTNIDHIKPLANGGKDEVVNFAITHESCNKSKQDADLNLARSLCVLNKILESAKSNKEVPSLKHVLLAKGGSKYEFKYKVNGDVLEYSFEDMGDVKIRKSEIFTDQLSGEKTVFIKVPIEYLYHDETINPRGINSSISLLIKEFYKSNPQLHLALAIIKNNRINIFDGQHKTVARLMLGVREIVVRIFISPDIERLTETNTTAGSKLKQIAFDKSIMRQLHDTLYTERIKKYQQDHLLSDDDFSFSES